MLKVERLHTHTIVTAWGWLAHPQAVYVHAHEDGDEEHEHENLLRVEVMIDKAEQEAG